VTDAPSPVRHRRPGPEIRKATVQCCSRPMQEPRCAQASHLSVPQRTRSRCSTPIGRLDAACRPSGSADNVAPLRRPLNGRYLRTLGGLGCANSMWSTGSPRAGQTGAGPDGRFRNAGRGTLLRRESPRTTTQLVLSGKPRQNQPSAPCDQTPSRVRACRGVTGRWAGWRWRDERGLLVGGAWTSWL
jgi:hypothetical protein